VKKKQGVWMVGCRKDRVFCGISDAHDGDLPMA